MENKREKSILIGVTGSIAAYKTCELVRNLVKEKYPVEVILSKNATRFIGPVTFEALSGRKVHTGDWDQGMLHIDLKNRAAIFAIVPATANIIGKFAAGLADDLISTTYLAATCPIVIAPAMNPGMYANKAVQRNLNILKEDNIIIMDPLQGPVICGDEGQGKMADIEQIKKLLIELFNKQDS